MLDMQRAAGNLNYLYHSIDTYLRKRDIYLHICKTEWLMKVYMFGERVQGVSNIFLEIRLVRMAFYGVNRDVMVRELNLKFKLAIQQRGGIGIRTLALIFRRMDFNGNKKLDSSEFEQALAAFG